MAQGEHGPRYSFTLNRRYKDKDGNWLDSDGYFEDDCLPLSEITREAYAWMKARRRAAAGARREKQAETAA